MSGSVRPHRQQPTRLPRPWDSPGKNTGVGCHFLLQCMKVKRGSKVAQSCPTLSNPMDRSLPGSSVHGIFQTKVLEWGAIAFSVFTHKHINKQTYMTLPHHSSHQDKHTHTHTHTHTQFCAYTHEKQVHYDWVGATVALVVKNLPANAGDIRDAGSIPGPGRSPE